MNIHQEVNDARLNMSLMLVNDDFFAGVVNLHVRVFLLIGLVKRLIFLLIMLDALTEIVESVFFVHVCVIRAAYFHLDDIRFD